MDKYDKMSTRELNKEFSERCSGMSINKTKSFKKDTLRRQDENTVIIENVERLLKRRI